MRRSCSKLKAGSGYPAQMGNRWGKVDKSVHGCQGQKELLFCETFHSITWISEETCLPVVLLPLHWQSVQSRCQREQRLLPWKSCNCYFCVDESHQNHAASLSFNAQCCCPHHNSRASPYNQACKTWALRAHNGGYIYEEKIYENFWIVKETLDYVIFCSFQGTVI